MHAIANSPAPSYSSSGRVNETLVAGIASLFLSPPSKLPSVESSSTIPIEKIYRIERHVPQYGVDLRSPGSNVNRPLAFDVVTSRHLNFAHKARGGFDVTELPVEIISDIFEKFMEDDLLHPIRDDTPRPLVSHTCRSDPTQLGQICSRWRTVAVNLPKLWSNILIYNPKTSQVHLTDVWLERSGKNALNLEISYDTGKGDYDVISATQILQSFITHLGRWKKFHLDMSIELLGPLYTIVHSPRKPHILESVSFEFCNSFGYQHAEVHIDEIWKYFHGCPTLRQVVWLGDEVDSFPKHAPSQLTHVHVWFSVSIDDILSFLPQVPLLQELQIESLRRPSNNTVGTTSLPLFLQDLRLLRILSREVPGTSFIGSLTCPSLESLEINHSNNLLQSNQDLQELPRFLRRSGCRLQKLRLCDPGINITDEELERCLSDSPLRSLTSLFLCVENISDKMAELFSRKSPAAGLHKFAPFLEKLVLLSCDTSDGLLASMVSSRWYEPLDDNHSTPLGYLREAGIFPKKDFGPIDEAFFSANFPY